MIMYWDIDQVEKEPHLGQDSKYEIVKVIQLEPVHYSIYNFKIS